MKRAVSYKKDGPPFWRAICLLSRYFIYETEAAGQDRPIMSHHILDLIKGAHTAAVVRRVIVVINVENSQLAVGVVVADISSRVDLTVHLGGGIIVVIGHDKGIQPVVFEVAVVERDNSRMICCSAVRGDS